jgi:hypothetical protein
MPRAGRRTRIGGQFAPRLIEMLESPAYRALNQSEHRMLSRLEIELASHGGTDNGNLPITFDDFVAYGINRHSVAPSMRALAALGFIEVTEHGRAGNAEWRRANKFRLTFRDTKQLDPGHEWRKIETSEQAEAIAVAARADKKQKSSVGKRTITSVGERTTNGHSHSAEPITTPHSAEPITTLDISGTNDEPTPIGAVVAGILDTARGRAAHPTGRRDPRAGRRAP